LFIVHSFDKCIPTRMFLDRISINNNNNHNNNVNANANANPIEVQQARKRITYKTKVSKQSIMGVFKSIRRRSQGRMLGSRKMLNYSAISDTSGNTHNESKEDSHDDMFAATAPLIPTSAPLIEEQERPTRIVSPIISPVASPMASPEKNKPINTINKQQKLKIATPKPKMTMQPKIIKEPKMTMEAKRVSLEPVAPLGIATMGVVVNEDEWEEISHISGISTRSESSAAKKVEMSSVEIQEDLDALAAAFEGTPIPVTPTKPIGTVVKPSTTTLTPPKRTIGKNVKNIAAAFEGGNTTTKTPIAPRKLVGTFTVKTSAPRAEYIAPPVVTPIANEQKESFAPKDVVQQDTVENSGNAIVHILTGVDGENAINGNTEDGSKVSHVFEDDQSSQHALVTDTSADSTPATTRVIPFSTRESSGPKYETVFNSDFEKEIQHSAPPMHPTIAPSFDGSASTAFTDNKSNKSSTRSVRTDADSTVSFKSVQEKLNAFDATMRSSVQKFAGDAAAMSPEFKTSSPACTSMFSSTSDIKANLKDSIHHIKKELNDFYESSGIAAAAAKAEEQVGTMKQSFFPKNQENNEMPDDNEMPNDEASHYSNPNYNSYSKDMFEDKSPSTREFPGENSF